MDSSLDFPLCANKPLERGSLRILSVWTLSNVFDNVASRLAFSIVGVIILLGDTGGFILNLLTPYIPS